MSQRNSNLQPSKDDMLIKSEGEKIQQVPTEEIVIAKKRNRSVFPRSETKPVPPNSRNGNALIFCCQSYEEHLKNDDRFSHFIETISYGVSDIIGLLASNPMESMIQVTIENMKQIEEPPKQRNIICFAPSQEYRLVNNGTVERFMGRPKVEFLGEVTFVCQEHQKAYKLLKYEEIRHEAEGMGAKKRELSAGELGRYKRMSWAKKASYGRKEEIDAAIRRVSYGNPALVKDGDYNLARLSLYLADIGLDAMIPSMCPKPYSFDAADSE